MASVLLVAHDPGGANLLSAVVGPLAGAGHEVAAAALGPAARLYDLEPDLRRVDPAAIEAGTDLPEGRWDVVVTGTSFSSPLERRAWALARRRGVPTLAAIDAWANFGRRFQESDLAPMVLPDAVAVIDGDCARSLADDGIAPKRVHVVGQPHLERLVGRLAPARAARDPAAAELPLVAYFSEPIAGNLPPDKHPGYDQFGVLEHVLTELRRGPPVSLVVQPHPRESAELWRRFMAERPLPAGFAVRVGQLERDRLLVDADLVLGMTSMVLVEAALIGVPVVSLQLGRRLIHNPVVAPPLVPTVVDPAGMAEAFRVTMTAGSPRPAPPFATGARARLAAAILAEAGRLR